MVGHLGFCYDGNVTLSTREFVIKREENGDIGLSVSATLGPEPCAHSTTKVVNFKDATKNKNQGKKSFLHVLRTLTLMFLLKFGVLKHPLKKPLERLHCVPSRTS